MVRVQMLLMLAGGVLAAAGAAELQTQTLKVVHYPVYDAQGQIKFDVTGDEAKIRPDGLIQITNLKMTFYEDGKVTMQIVTPECLFDRVKSVAVSTAEVCVSRAEIVLTGKGFEWHANEECISVHERSKVVIRNTADRSGSGSAP